jgi:hypothetical protein
VRMSVEVYAVIFQDFLKLCPAAFISCIDVCIVFGVLYGVLASDCVSQCCRKF